MNTLHEIKDSLDNNVHTIDKYNEQTKKVLGEIKDKLFSLFPDIKINQQALSSCERALEINDLCIELLCKLTSRHIIITVDESGKNHIHQTFYRCKHEVMIIEDSQKLKEVLLRLDGYLIIH